MLTNPSPTSGLVVVALSGGVDSATCAGLLAEAGVRVVGITMRLYNARGTVASSGGRCCGPADLEDARAVCAHLGIPFYVADYEEAFERAVMDDFVSSYAAGKTPNPCVRCNEKVKFLPMLHRARALGATTLATGHYARIERVANTGEYRLLKAIDPDKDQSYFLFGMPKDSLPMVSFPLGGLRKEEVRAHARRLGLPNADKPESQEICFVPDGDHAGFVKGRAKETPLPGELVDENGVVVGTHDGIHRFTIGQRRGIGVGLGDKRYVVSIDALTRRVHVGPKESLRKDTLVCEGVRYLRGPLSPSERRRAEVQIRYRHRPQPAWISALSENLVQVTFDEPQFAVAPGQAAVFYDGEEVIGGGFIAAPAKIDGVTSAALVSTLALETSSA